MSVTPAIDVRVIVNVTEAGASNQGIGKAIEAGEGNQGIAKGIEAGVRVRSAESGGGVAGAGLSADVTTIQCLDIAFLD